MLAAAYKKNDCIADVFFLHYIEFLETILKQTFNLLCLDGYFCVVCFRYDNKKKEVMDGDKFVLRCIVKLLSRSFFAVCERR